MSELEIVGTEGERVFFMIDPLKRNQRLLITVLDEFFDTEAGVKALRGGLSKYANPELRLQERSAWASAVEKKHEMH